MKLSKNIIKKYNSLLIEVSDYYDKSIHTGYCGLYTIYAIDLGYTGIIALYERSTDSAEVKEFLEMVKLDYKHLLPFYELYFTQIKNSGIDFQEDMFSEINAVMGKIRKENSVS